MLVPTVDRLLSYFKIVQLGEMNSGSYYQICWKEIYVYRDKVLTISYNTKVSRT